MKLFATLNNGYIHTKDYGVLTILNEFFISFTKKERTLLFFDIDGVVCKTGHHTHEIQLSDEEYIELKKKYKCTPQFIESVQLIQHVNTILKREGYLPIDVKFLTGRRVNVKEITEEMFAMAKIPDFTPIITYFPDNYIWNTDDYKHYKEHHIREMAKIYDKVYYFDDTTPLIDHLHICNLPENVLVHHYSAL